MSDRPWQKLGLVFTPDGSLPWMRSHASLPMARPLDDGRVRVLFASRDERNRSHIGAVTLDRSGSVVEGPPEQPLLAPGAPGDFDGDGVYPGSLARADDGHLHLYYIGWNSGSPAPMFYATIGLAISDDEGRSFVKRGRVPLLARGEHDPCLVTSPCVLRDGGRWRMWYVSGLRWERLDHGLQSFYHVKYAESDDGITWRRDGHVCIELSEGEYNIARPCVVAEDGRYRMWYSFNRGEGYRPGYAESDDGLTWTRRDDRVGITPSASGWDSEAIAYPWVVELGERELMLYNGNGYGRDGFGAAVRERD